MTRCAVTPMFLIFIYIFCSPIYATPKPQAKLKHINQEIERVRQTIATKTQKQSQLLNSLQANEQSIHHISKKLQHSRQKIENHEAILSKLRHEEAAYQKALADEKTYLAEQIRAAYLLKKASYFKAALGGANLNDYQRMMIYEHKITESCLARFAKFQVLLSKLTKNKAQLQTHTEILKQLHQQLKNQRESLAQANKHRRETLIAVSHTLADKQKHLQVLVSDKHALETLIRQLEANRRATQAYGEKFYQAQGKLPWPLHGRIMHHFSDRIAQSDLKWNATVIEAKSGDPVRAIAPGKVIFSGWMARYGLLTIVDHGKGYMSLYAQNQTLLHQKDDWIQAGDLIAKVGNTGGQMTPSLYFGIWHNGRPTDPERWCKGKLKL